MTPAARSFHALTSAVATGALVLQLVLVCRGDAILDRTGGDPTDVATRLVRFVSYLTI